VSGAERLTVAWDGGIARLTMDNPASGNAFDVAMLETFPRVLAEIAADARCRVLILQGAGADFCTGRDPASVRAQTGLSAYALRQELAKIAQANAALGDFPMPTVALVRGRALGFGAGLAARCDLAYATSDAIFGFPELRGGLPPTIVISFLGKAIARRHAMELVLTGGTISAAEAARLDLVNHVVEPDQLEAAVDGFAQEVAAKDAVAVAVVKRFFNDVRDLGWEQASKVALDILAVAMRRD
jgi:enoyl-CoA hydratase/carnithine racemase